MRTEFMQALNPVRIHTSTPDNTITHPVFALRIASDNQIDYMTINGMLYRSCDILFAEQFINGEWTRLAYREKYKTNPH
jgi:hypothetical protein